MPQKIYNVLAGVAVVATLMGCGESITSEAPTPGSTASEPTAKITFNGTAAKGIINKGTVVAKELNPDKTELAEVGTAKTSVDGSYSLTLASSYKGGPIEVTISADANTEMKCDVPKGCGTASNAGLDLNNNGTVDFGEWYKPGRLMMSALVAKAKAGDTIGANITPYTHMAARRAKEAATLDSTAVFKANSEVSTLLGGIDILNTQPLDITDAKAVAGGTATEISYAASSAAIAALAVTASGVPDINAALTTLSDSFQGGSIAAESGNGALISLQDIVTATHDVLAEAGTEDTSGVLAAMQSSVDAAVLAGGNVDPTPNSSAGESNLAKVKAFVRDVRTWGTVINTEVGAKSDAFATQVDLASAAANASQGFLVSEALGAAIEAVIERVSGNSTSTDLSTYAVGPVDFFTGQILGPQFTAGSIVQSAGKVTITGGVIGGVDVAMSVALPDSGSILLAGSTLNVEVLSALFTSTDADIVINSGSISLDLSSAYTVDYAAMAVDPKISAAAINLDVVLTQKRGFDQFAGFDPVTGASGQAVVLNSNITFSGTLSAILSKPVTDSMGNMTWITPKNLTLSGNVSDALGNNMDAKFTLNITNADAFAPVGGLAVGTIKADMATWSYNENTFVLTSPDQMLTIVWNSPTSTTVTESYYGNVFTYDIGYTSYANIQAAVTDQTSWYSEAWYYVDGEGAYTVDYLGANFSLDGSASGRLTSSDFVLEGAGANQWLKGNVGLDFSLQLAGLPKASINISGTRTDFDAGNAAVTISYGSRQIVISAEQPVTPANMTTAPEPVAELTITNQDGVRMVVPLNLNTVTGDVGDLTFNGVSYAGISNNNGVLKITYIDGTFETF